MQQKSGARFRGNTCWRPSHGLDTNGGNLDRVVSGADLQGGRAADLEIGLPRIFYAKGALFP